MSAAAPAHPATIARSAGPARGPVENYSAATASLSGSGPALTTCGRVLIVPPASFLRDVHRVAQCRPDVPWRDVRSQRLVGSAAAEGREHLGSGQRARVPGTELVVHESPEVAVPHEASIARTVTVAGRWHDQGRARRLRSLLSRHP